MKKSLLYFTLLLLLSLSSCLEIIEDIKLNSDGSGSFKLIVNMSQSKSQLDKIFSQDSIQGHVIPKKNTIITQFQSLLENLKNQTGITEVLGNSDLENYKTEISLKFNNLQSLNLALKNIIKFYNPKFNDDVVVVSFDGKTFGKNYNSNLLAEAYKEKKKVSALLTGFEQAKITCISRFENPISEINHTKAVLSTSKKNCIEHILLDDLLINNDLHTLEIKL
jgi:hypothetical protein